MYLSAILEEWTLGSNTRREDTTVIMPDGLIGGAEAILMYSLFFAIPERIAVLFFYYEYIGGSDNLPTVNLGNGEIVREQSIGKIKIVGLVCVVDISKIRKQCW